MKEFALNDAKGVLQGTVTIALQLFKSMVDKTELV